MPKKQSGLTPADEQRRVLRIIRSLSKAYPVALCALNHTSPFQLLVATILSAQCTDERVNMVTPALFARYPTAQDLSQAKQDELEEIVRSTGFYRNKAKNLIGMATAVTEQYGGTLPQSLPELVALPGIGRKTANVLLGTAFGIPSGIVVDTHVARISKLLGLTSRKNAEHIEQDLMQWIPEKEWINFSHRLIHHGRRVCIARRPKCRECPLLQYCARVGLPELTD